MSSLRFYILIFLLAATVMADRTDDFSEEEDYTIEVVSIFFSTISFLGSTFIVVMYLRHPELRSFIFQIVVWISASDMIYSLANALGNPSDGTDACYAQAVMIQFFGLSSMLWTVAIAFTVDQVYLKGKSLDDATQLKKNFHLFVWPASTLLTILPATTGNYGSATGWCWIDVKHNADWGTTWRFLCFYVPLWAVAVYNLTVYYRVRVALNEAIEQGGSKAGSVQRMQRLIYYPLVLVGCYFFGTINRIENIFAKPVYVLVVFHTIGMSSQGTLNALVYGLSPSVKQVIMKEYCGGKGVQLNDEFSEGKSEGLVDISVDDFKRQMTEEGDEV